MQEYNNGNIVARAVVEDFAVCMCKNVFAILVREQVQVREASVKSQQILSCGVCGDPVY